MVEVLNERSQSETSLVEKHFVFQCGATWFALPALSVREVMSRPKMFPVPHCQQALAGLCHVRSEFLPVLHLQSLLGETAPQLMSCGQMLVVNATSGAWGLLVDRAVAIEALDLSINPDVRLDDELSAAFLGTAAFGENIVRVLDPTSLYRLAEESLR